MRFPQIVTFFFDAFNFGGFARGDGEVIVNDLLMIDDYSSVRLSAIGTEETLL
jgi:hypothetical protein